jgi:ferric-chelate reductase [NAD(P)H]
VDFHSQLFDRQKPFKPGITQCPLAAEHALSVLEARVMDQVDLGSHTIFMGETLSAKILKDGHAITYQDYH